MTTQLINGQLYSQWGGRCAGPPPPDRVRCTDCGTSRPLGEVDCPVCDVPSGHVHGRHSAAGWVYQCPDCGAVGTHAPTCSMFPGERVEHGNRVALPRNPGTNGDKA
jgi:hypothetical protein